MKIGIICAGDEELAPFLPLIKNCRITEKATLKFYDGQIDGVKVVALFSGVCKVNAAIAAQLLIDAFCVDMIINSGTAGSMALTVQGRLKGPRVEPGFEPGKVHSLSCRGSWAKNRTRKGTLVTKVSASARGWAICTPRSPMTIGSTSISGR